MSLNSISGLLLAIGTLLAALASIGALWLGHKNRRQLKPSNGRTIAEISENTNQVARDTRRDIYRLAIALGEHLQHSDQARKQLGLPPESLITDPFPEPPEYPPGYDRFYGERREHDTGYRITRKGDGPTHRWDDGD